MQKLLGAIFLITCLSLLSLAALRDPTLRGSPASMERQHREAVRRDYTFMETAAQVEEMVEMGRLVPLPGGPDYELARVSYPVARPEVRAFVERIANGYRQECGEKLVVTSLTRPQAQQPGNAHQLSVHPAGMAVDFRVSRENRCRDWLEAELLKLERQEVLDITRERNPPHYHVAVFPAAFNAWAARQPPLERAPDPEAAPAPAIAAAPGPAPASAPAAAEPAPPADTRRGRIAGDDGLRAGELVGLLMMLSAVAFGAVLLMRRQTGE